ncbi:MAG: hypothetical protein Q8R15_01690, partial [Candidatus Micrarchaeota archaeon]|nr:hypothetical protein [Candidatus Micrarchaeota archaeon]
MSKAPHVILLVGPHAAGFESAVRDVVKKEAPSLISMELVARPKIREDTIAALGKDPRKLLRHPDQNVVVVAGMHLLAEELGIKFGFVETHTEQEYVNLLKKREEADSGHKRAMQAALNGDVEAAINFQRQALNARKEISKAREPKMVETLYEAAVKEGKPVAALVGNIHIDLAKRLVQRGAKVTVYYSAPGYPFTSGLLSRSMLPATKRTDLLRETFQGIVLNYLLQRYNLPPALLLHTLSGINARERFKKITNKDMEEYLQNAAHKSAVAQRVDL